MVYDVYLNYLCSQGAVIAVAFSRLGDHFASGGTDCQVGMT